MQLGTRENSILDSQSPKTTGGTSLQCITGRKYSLKPQDHPTEGVTVIAMRMKD